MPIAPLPIDLPASRAAAEFRRMMKWIALAAILMVAASLYYLSLFSALSAPVVAATVGGVFLSVMLGSGLFAAAFFSDKSGHDLAVAQATRTAPAPEAATVLPEGLAPYRQTALFTETSIPAGLLGDHMTKAGTWGLIRVVEGRLRYRVTDPRRARSERILSPADPPGIVEPTILHAVEPLGAVRFQVEFFR